MGVILVRTQGTSSLGQPDNPPYIHWQIFAKCLLSVNPKDSTQRCKRDRDTLSLCCNLCPSGSKPGNRKMNTNE